MGLEQVVAVRPLHYKGLEFWPPCPGSGKP